MTVKELSLYLIDEDKAEDYLRDKKILIEFSQCPACSSGHIGRIRRQKIKCYECKYEWNIRKNSFLESRHVQLSEFIGVIKMFSDEISASKCSQELEMNRKKVEALYNYFRQQLFNIEKLKCAELTKMKFLIRNVKGLIHISIDVDELKEEGANLTIKRSKNFDNAYRYLISYKNLRVKNVLRTIEKIDKLDDFYRFCQERLITFRSRDERQLLWKLLELEFRYNHRHDDIFDLLINKLSN